jgi:hypothetical protein
LIKDFAIAFARKSKKLEHKQREQLMNIKPGIKTLLLFFILTGAIYSKDVKKVSVLLVKNEKVLNKIISDVPPVISKRDSSAFIELPIDSNMVKHDPSNTYTVTKDNYLVFLFYNDSNERVQLKDIKRLHISVFSNTVELNFESKYALFELNKLGSKPKNKSLITVDVTADTIKQKNYFQYRNSSELYSAFGNILGFWFPINMYSTNFERSENGILFSAMPAGIAWGGKWNTSSDFYLGMSVVCNWTIANAKDRNKNSFFLHDLSFGILADFGGWIYFGYAHPINLTNQPLKLNNQFIFCVGSYITNFFAGKNN